MVFVRLAIVSLIFVIAGDAQQAKRALKHSDYDQWKSIAGQTLSPDGRYLVYSLFPQEGDGQLVIRNLTTGSEVRKSVGAMPPPPDTEETENTEGPPPPRGIRIAITSDNAYAVATTYPAKAETDQARKDRKPADRMPRPGLLIVPLATGVETRIADVQSMQVPEHGGAWVAYRKGAKPASPTASEAKPATGDEDQRGGGASRGGQSRSEFGTDLVLRNLSSGEERVFEDVNGSAFAKDGKNLVYAVSSRTTEKNGVFTVTPGSAAAPVALLEGKGKYTTPAFDRLEKQLVFLSDHDQASKFKAYWWDRSAAQASAISDGTGLQAGYGFVDRGTVGFSRDGSRIYLPVMLDSAARRAAQAATATPAAGGSGAIAEEKVLADLWHWKDDYVQPMQKVRAQQERSRTYRAVYHIADRKLVQVADPSLATINPSDDGRWAVGSDDRRYRSMVDYDGAYSDLHLIDTVSGARTPLIEKYRGAATWSPKGTHLLAFKRGQWWSVRPIDNYLTDLTGSLGVNFYNEQHDSPSEAQAYGNGGWTKDGDGVLLYDMYDVWYVSADAKTSRRLTRGREDKIQYRVARLDVRPPGADDEDERGIDPAKPLYLRAESTVTRDSGFFRLANLSGSASAEKLLMGPKNYREAAKARDADVVVISAQTFNEEPNLYATNANLRDPNQVSEANPQKASMLWGSSELISFKNADGVALQAALYKPENFDPKKKYPLMVYIYERLSQGLHTFVAPRPGHSVNFAYYVSNGYLVLTPDIVYTVGSPGQSALKCVLPAVQEVVDRGFVEESAIGIQGHSWGGYQIAYMLTRTNRFRAAEAGAPVGNMTSAYNGIRWGTGLPRQFQYEKTQSRIGGSLWDSPLEFIENSPVFRANRVNTPLLILHDDEDDAVPWYQGIELFLSLRRNGKEAYLFNYNGEKHGLRKRHNQKDYTVRLQQFFDHFLKGAPAPEWMEKGIPYLDREDEKKKLHSSAYEATSDVKH